MNRLIDELRKQYPGLSKKSERSPLAAIRLFCLECMGGYYKEIDVCSAPKCPLYRYRFGYGVNDKRAGEHSQIVKQGQISTISILQGVGNTSIDYEPNWLSE